MSETTISAASSEELLALFGPCDRHVRAVRDALGVNISARDGRIHVAGAEESVIAATKVLQRLQVGAKQFGAVTEDDVAHALASVREGSPSQELAPLEVFVGRQVRSRTPGQGQYLKTMRENELVFCTGPAGTGKTYLAVAMAVAALKEEQIRKIVLVRPAVEAGESLGFLPGDLQAKINPYLRPLLDSLQEMMEHDMIRRYTEEDLIEVIPLAYMRGRTLNDAFIILDEAQNTTVSQMKMFLTRMGNGSRVVVSGDVTQVDLPSQTRSGLIDGLSRLRGIRGIGAVELTRHDIVRHPLVQRIVEAYEQKRTPKRP